MSSYSLQHKSFLFFVSVCNRRPKCEIFFPIGLGYPIIDKIEQSKVQSPAPHGFFCSFPSDFNNANSQRQHVEAWKLKLFPFRNRYRDKSKSRGGTVVLINIALENISLMSPIRSWDIFHSYISKSRTRIHGPKYNFLSAQQKGVDTASHPGPTCSLIRWGSHCTDRCDEIPSWAADRPHDAIRLSEKISPHIDNSDEVILSVLEQSSVSSIRQFQVQHIYQHRRYRATLWEI
jgi:hypothetical protein